MYIAACKGKQNTATREQICSPRNRACPFRFWYGTDGVIAPCGKIQRRRGGEKEGERQREIYSGRERGRDSGRERKKEREGWEESERERES